MKKPAGKRSPTAHRTKAQERAEGTGYGGSAKQKENRAARNKARAHYLKTGAVKVGDNLDVDHKNMLIKGGSKALSNTRVRSRKANRGWEKT